MISNFDFQRHYSTKVPTFYDYDLSNSSQNSYECLYLDLEKTPHILIVGTTGSGKTYAAKLLLARLSRSFPESKIVIADYKGDKDFSFLNGQKGFFRFNACGKWFDYAIELLEYRQASLREGDYIEPMIFFFDELAAYLTSLDKKEETLRLGQLQQLLMLGRSFDIHIIISQQRPDAAYFGRARDNFSVVISLGALSKEVVGMLFSEYADLLKRNLKRGFGYALIDGVGLKRIIVPTAKYPENVNGYIRMRCGLPKREDNG